MLDHMAVLKGVASGKDRKETVESLLNQVNLWPVRKKASPASRAACASASASPRP
jgi:ABC-type multidrug transport system ATPase subunit